jgi:hypothetical protein
VADIQALKHNPAPEPRHLRSLPGAAS